MFFGPTSSGKTALSLELAAAAASVGLRPVVLNADSRQIYKGMDIGTSKITHADMGGVEHRLIDIADPAGKLGLDRYVSAARKELEELSSDPSALPIFVGGTLTYAQAIASAWSVSGYGIARRELAREFPRSETDQALRLLRRIDPAAASRFRPHDYEGLLNALARAMTRDTPSGNSGLFTFTVIAVDRGQTETERRIALTLDHQLRVGLLQEIDDLDQRLGLVVQYRKYGPSAPSVVLQTHGYREFLVAASQGGRSVGRLSRRQLHHAKSAALDHVRRYSRRQRAGFRKLNVVHLASDDGSVETILNLVGDG